MAVSDKNLVITPNIGSATDEPSIVFSGADASTGAQNITLKIYPTNNGTLAFEGSTGQLFSITNSGNVTIGLSTFKTSTYTTSNTSQVTLDSFAVSAYRSIKYFVQISSGSNHHVTEISVVHNDTTPYIVEYGENKTGSSLGTFDASISGVEPDKVLNLLFTPANSSTTVKLVRYVLVV